jgi:hypothetical protein
MRRAAISDRLASRVGGDGKAALLLFPLPLFV